MGLAPQIVRVLIVVLATLVSVTAQAAPCRNYPAAAARAIKPRVATLRQGEREAAGPPSGLDSPPLPFLNGRARARPAPPGRVLALRGERGRFRCPADRPPGPRV